MENEKEFIFAKSNNLLVKIKISDITYIQALGDYVNIFTNEKRHTVHITLEAIKQKLTKDKFSQIHRSYIVGLKFVGEIEVDTVYIEKHRLPIGEKYKESFFNAVKAA